MCQENINHTITPPPPAWTVETRQDDPCFHVPYAKFWPYHLNAAEIETHQIRQRFSNLLLSNFGDPVWIVAWSQSPLKEVELFHIWLPNSGIAFLITFGVQTHSLYLNLDLRHISLAKHSYNASHNIVLQLYLIKRTWLCFSLGWTNNFCLDWTTAALIMSLFVSLFLIPW